MFESYFHIKQTFIFLFWVISVNSQSACKSSLNDFKQERVDHSFAALEEMIIYP